MALRLPGGARRVRSWRAVLLLATGRAEPDDVRAVRGGGSPRSSASDSGRRAPLRRPTRSVATADPVRPRGRRGRGAGRRRSPSTEGCTGSGGPATRFVDCNDERYRAPSSTATRPTIAPRRSRNDRCLVDLRQREPRRRQPRRRPRLHRRPAKRVDLVQRRPREEQALLADVAEVDDRLGLVAVAEQLEDHALAELLVVTSSPAHSEPVLRARRGVARAALPRPRRWGTADLLGGSRAPPAARRLRAPHQLLGDLRQEAARRVVVGRRTACGSTRGTGTGARGPGDPHVAEAPLLLSSSSGRRGCACGNTPSSIPVRNTTGYSSPLAVCSVMSVTALCSPSPSSSSRSVTSEIASRNAVRGQASGTTTSPGSSAVPTPAIPGSPDEVAGVERLVELAARAHQLLRFSIRPAPRSSARPRAREVAACAPVDLDGGAPRPRRRSLRPRPIRAGRAARRAPSR